MIQPATDLTHALKQTLHHLFKDDEIVQHDDNAEFKREVDVESDMLENVRELKSMLKQKIRQQKVNMEEALYSWAIRILFNLFAKRVIKNSLEHSNYSTGFSAASGKNDLKKKSKPLSAKNKFIQFIFLEYNELRHQEVQKDEERKKKRLNYFP